MGNTAPSHAEEHKDGSYEKLPVEPVGMEGSKPMLPKEISSPLLKDYLPGETRLETVPPEYNSQLQPSLFWKFIFLVLLLMYPPVYAFVGFQSTNDVAAHAAKCNQDRQTDRLKEKWEHWDPGTSCTNEHKDVLAQSYSKDDYDCDEESKREATDHCKEVCLDHDECKYFLVHEFSVFPGRCNYECAPLEECDRGKGGEKDIVYIKPSLTTAKPEASSESITTSSWYLFGQAYVVPLVHLIFTIFLVISSGACTLSFCFFVKFVVILATGFQLFMLLEQSQSDVESCQDNGQDRQYQWQDLLVKTAELIVVLVILCELEGSKQRLMDRLGGMSVRHRDLESRLLKHIEEKSMNLETKANRQCLASLLMGGLLLLGLFEMIKYFWDYFDPKRLKDEAHAAEAQGPLGSFFGYVAEEVGNAGKSMTGIDLAAILQVAVAGFFVFILSSPLFLSLKCIMQGCMSRASYLGSEELREVATSTARLAVLCEEQLCRDVERLRQDPDSGLSALSPKGTQTQILQGLVVKTGSIPDIPYVQSEMNLRAVHLLDEKMKDEIYDQDEKAKQVLAQVEHDVNALELAYQETLAKSTSLKTQFFHWMSSKSPKASPAKSATPSPTHFGGV